MTKTEHLPAPGPEARVLPHRVEAQRLIALALDILDDRHEQITRDYLSHALRSLDPVRDSRRVDQG